jgi:hypothetical protein
MEREVPHLRILSNELATAVKAKLGEGAKRFGRKAVELAAVGQKVSRVNRNDACRSAIGRPVLRAMPAAGSMTTA